MAQLTDDCFAFSGPLLPVEEVERIIRARVAPAPEVEAVPLKAAQGRVIARDVVAPIDLPPFDNSAVDGYAVRHADLNGKAETRLPVVERVTAGRAAALPLAAGGAIRIFTGAPMPAGAGTGFLQADVRRAGGAGAVPRGRCARATQRGVGEAVETIGGLVVWRVGIKPGRPVAMGVISSAGGGAAFVGLPGNPAAVYVTFARIVRPLLLRLAGAEAAPLMPLPVRAAFAYRKRAGRREYVRVKLVRATDGTVEATKHAQEGAGIITSLTETDGLVELPEDVTTVTPGATVGFLSYAALAA